MSPNAEDSSKERKANPFKSFLTGGFGGICNVLSGHPLDTIKVRLQTMPRPEPGEPPMYRGTFDCAAKTIRAEGVRGLYKGMSAPLTGVAPIFAMCFAGYAVGKRIQQTGNTAELTYPQIFVAGGFSGLFSTLITAPGERIKCLLQVQQASGGEKKYNGMADTAFKLYKEGGIRSVFKGTCATLLRDLPANGLYFLVYEYFQDVAKQKSETGKISTASTIFAGGAAGMAYWILGMPADVLKSRLQTDVPANGCFFLCYDAMTSEYKKRWQRPHVDLFPAIVAGGCSGICYWIAGMPADVLKSRLQTAPEGTYKYGVRSVFVELIRLDGPLALYRGISPVMIRAFPANAATFFGIELANAFFRAVAPDF